MDFDTFFLELDDNMCNVIKSFSLVLSNARTGRANPKMFDSLQIEYYGVLTQVNQIASISIPEGNQIYIKPYDKSCVSLIEKAIFAGNFGVTPQNDGIGVRVILPPMTEENRRNVSKDLSKKAEEYKVQIRSLRQDANALCKQSEKDKEISEDMLKGYLEDIQELTDKKIKEIDTLLEEKIKEVMTI